VNECKPLGVGTLDEIFEVLALLQLRRIGSAEPVPFLVMNYDGCYDGRGFHSLKFQVDLGVFSTETGRSRCVLHFCCASSSSCRATSQRIPQKELQVSRK
jgi:predicted Rossmann-fold nucleotide-binding protein